MAPDKISVTKPPDQLLLSLTILNKVLYNDDVLLLVKDRPEYTEALNFNKKLGKVISMNNKAAQHLDRDLWGSLLTSLLDNTSELPPVLGVLQSVLEHTQVCALIRNCDELKEARYANGTLVQHMSRDDEVKQAISQSDIWEELQVVASHPNQVIQKFPELQVQKEIVNDTFLSTTSLQERHLSKILLVLAAFLAVILAVQLKGNKTVDNIHSAVQNLEFTQDGDLKTLLKEFNQLQSKLQSSDTLENVKEFGINQEQELKRLAQAADQLQLSIQEVILPFFRSGDCNKWCKSFHQQRSGLQWTQSDESDREEVVVIKHNGWMIMLYVFALCNAGGLFLMQIHNLLILAKLDNRGLRHDYADVYCKELNICFVIEIVVHNILMCIFIIAWCPRFLIFNVHMTAWQLFKLFSSPSQEVYQHSEIKENIKIHIVYTSFFKIFFYFVFLIVYILCLIHLLFFTSQD